MDITQIENRIASLAQALGYDSIIVSKQASGTAPNCRPTAQILLPKILYVEGRDKDVICHGIEVIILDNIDANTADNKSNILSKMHDDLLDIFLLFSQDSDVVEIEDISISPLIIDTHMDGDIAQICKAKVVTYF